MAHQFGFLFPLVELLGKGEKIENVRVCEKIARLRGLALRQAAWKIMDLSALSVLSVKPDHRIERVPASAVFEGLAGIPEMGWLILDLLDQLYFVRPGIRESAFWAAGISPIARRLGYSSVNYS